MSFFGLLTAYKNRAPKLSKKGQLAMAALGTEVGAENVQLRAVQAIMENEEVVIRSGLWSLE